MLYLRTELPDASAPRRASEMERKKGAARVPDGSLSRSNSAVRQYRTTDGIRTPDPQLWKFSKLVLLIYFGEYCICLDWLSGALVGVGGSDFIGHSFTVKFNSSTVPHSSELSVVPCSAIVSLVEFSRALRRSG